jgi:putative redox protein
MGGCSVRARWVVAEERLLGIARVEGAAGYAQTIRAGHHRLTADEPASIGGTDTGPGPYGLLLSALGACTSITLRMYADRKGWELGVIRVSLRFFSGSEAERIEREVHFSAQLEPAQLSRLAEICERTPVTRLLKRSVTIGTEVAHSSEGG